MSEPFYDDSYPEALKWAAKVHATQPRKGTPGPYIPHLLRVSATIWEYGGDVTQAIAGVLHDAAEDHGGQERLDEIGRRFGPEVACIVELCSDSLVDTTHGGVKAEWRARKEAHLAHLRDVDERVKLVVASDKLDNLESTVRDISAGGFGEVMGRFNASPAEQVWFYRSVADIVRPSVPPAMMERFDTGIEALVTIVGSEQP